MSTMVTVAALKDQVESGLRPQIVDARKASEFASGHIPCAANIPMDQFDARRKDLRLDDGVVLACAAGSRDRPGRAGHWSGRCGSVSD